jgi:molecular chaperone DnaK
VTISVGIDLGTTNTSIATFDGRRVEVAKQVGGAMGSGSETTPSAIFIDENGAMHVGDKAYVQVAQRPEDVARGWKRLLGTGVDIKFASANMVKSPEWCSTELLKRVFGYLPAQVRTSDDISVVITVPAAFGQVKNEATVTAANAAGLSNIKLMPEPVAACIAVMEKDRSDKTFLVYDLGGGTFDVSIATFKDGAGSIIAQGGIEANGGRDWDFAIVNRVIVPWLKDNYKLTADDLNSNQMKNVLAMYAEQGKIELSQSYATNPSETASVFIQVPVGDIKVDKKRLTDADGNEVGLNVELKKSHIDEITNELIDSTVNACRIVASDSGVDLSSVNYVVFIGGPTLYGPLRERVAAELGVNVFPQFIDPMTAVAKGAAIYAESLAAGEAKPKTEVQSSSAEFPIDLSYESRVSGNSADLTLTLNSLEHESVEFEIKNPAYSSGQMTLNFSKTISLPLTDEGRNSFTIEVQVPGNKSAITKSIEIDRVIELMGIPVAKSLFVEVLSRDGRTTEPEYLIRVGERLPKQGEFKVAAQVALTAKSSSAISFRLYQGEISDRVADNTFIGELKLDSAELGKLDKINIGDELICGYEVDEGLGLKLSVSVPSIGQKFDGLYVSGEAIKNPTEDWQEFAESARNLKRSLERYVQANPNEELEGKIGVIDRAIQVIESSLVDEEVQSSAEQVRQIKRDFFEARQGDLPKRLMVRFRNTVEYYQSSNGGRVIGAATNAEKKIFAQHAQLAEAAARAGNEQLWNDEDDELWEVIRDIIWRSEWWLKAELEDALKSGSASQKEKAKAALEGLKEGKFAEARTVLSDIFRENNQSASPGVQGVNVKRI